MGNFRYLFAILRLDLVELYFKAYLINVMEHPITAAIYVKADNDHIASDTATDLKARLTYDGCKLSDERNIYIDSDPSLKSLQDLVNAVKTGQFQVVYVAHNTLPEDKPHYDRYIRQLYAQGVSILLCN